MADNILATASSTVTLATDDIGGVHYPRTKISVGADGSATDVSSANPLPITAPDAIDVNIASGTATVSGSVSITGSLPAGTNNIGDVDVLSVPKTAQTTRVPVWASGQHLAVTGTSNRTTALTATEVMVAPSINCYLRIGNSSVAATEGAGSVYLAAGSGPHVFQITTGEYVALIKATGASDGIASVVPIA